MSRNSSARSSTPRKGGSLLAGILVGMVLGVAIAGGVAWYILKIPSPFVNKADQRHAAPEPEVQLPATPATATPPHASAVAATSGVGDGKPRFEFYKVLTDKQDATLPTQGDSGKPAKPATAQPTSKPSANEPYFLQAASFSNADEADKLKAKLALLGIEASVQTVTVPDKGVWHRVRLGPYSNTDEMNKVRATLKQNGVDATPIRGQ